MAAVMNTGANVMQTTIVSKCFLVKEDFFEHTDLQHESGKAPGVIVHDETTAVTDHLRCASKRE